MYIVICAGGGVFRIQILKLLFIFRYKKHEIELHDAYRRRAMFVRSFVEIHMVMVLGLNDVHSVRALIYIIL